MEKFILNETSYFGEGARKALPDEKSFGCYR